MFSKFAKWLKSTAGIISILLLISSFLLVIFLIINNGFSIDKRTDTINNILIGISTNLIGIIVTVSFVQFFLDKQNMKCEKEEENKKIKRYNRCMSVIIQRYLIYYNCVTSPMDKRSTLNPLEMNRDFRFEDMCDLYGNTMLTCEGVFESSIERFYKYEEMLRDYLISMIQNIDFKYNESIKEVIIKFVEESICNDMRGGILGNISVTVGKEKFTDVVKKSIKENNEDWLKKYEKNELNSNIMLPYVQLYYMLKSEIYLLDKYLDLVSKL